VAPYPDTLKVAFIGVLERQKGVDVLLEAWKNVIQNIPEAHLVMAGSGSLLSDVRREVARASLSAHVTVEGQLPHSDVKALIDASSVVVLPSRSEGLGLVIIEAFLRARPVVGTAVGGIPELISDRRNGLLVPPEDPKRLAAALKELLLSPALGLAMGQEGRRDIITRRPRQEFESGIARVASWVAE
jgi:glycosyltransferase involved in cell wall biosynthesis